MKSYVEKYLGDARPVPENYLEHHGVMGMKWGKRNAETLARYARDAGSRGVKAVREAVSKGSKGVAKKLDAAGRTVKSLGGKALRGIPKVIKKASAMHTSYVRHKIDKAIRNGDMATVYKYRKKMSGIELNEAISRADKYSKIQSRLTVRQGKPTPKPMSKRQYKKYSKAYLKGNQAKIAKYTAKLTTDELKDIQARLKYLESLKPAKGKKKGLSGGEPMKSEAEMKWDRKLDEMIKEIRDRNGY